MGFIFYIYIMEYRGVCSNPWCKAHFIYTDDDMVLVSEDMRSTDEVKVPPRQCKKCISFDTELSGGVKWVDKEYEGSRNDGMPHEIKYKVTNFKL